ncbi:MAG: adenylate/guanylate cyclase domain-containing protein [Candidatus Rokuibacteriota bacterium]|nr:MAG: adenylate/guanylate cyclase domain-containing protein [Candidatus Rokubacteria bacterium]
MYSSSVLASPEKIRSLLEVLQTLAQELELDKLLQLIMEKTSHLMNADRSTLFLVDEERKELWSKIAQGVGLKEIRIPIGRGVAGTVALTGETVNVLNAYLDPRFKADLDKRTGYQTRTILCVPVRDSGNKIIGALQVLNKVVGAFSTNDEDLLRSLAAQVAIAVRNAEQVDQIQRRRRISEILLDVMKSFSAELDVDQLLRKIVARTSEVMNAERSTLFVVDRKTEEIWSKVAEGAGLVEIRIPIGRGVAGVVAATGESINITDAYRDPRFDQTVDERTGYRTRTILCAPIHNAQGEVVGVAEVLNKKGDIFTREDEEFLSALAAQAFIALDNARLFEAVVYMRNYNESILRSMATGVVTVDPDGRVGSVNPAFEAIFGLQTNWATSPRVEQFLGASNESLIAQLRRCAAAGEAYKAYDLKYVLPTGDPISVNLSVVPLRDSKQNPMGIVAVAEDITKEQRLMSTLCRYVTREVAEYVLKDRDKLKLGGNRQEVSVLFCDIRGFTTLTEEYAPEDLVGLLNEYFSLMVREIFNQQGTLDKFIGDAVMAVFGAPITRADDPLRAVRAALGMRHALKAFNLRQTRAQKPTVETGIGICHGEAVSGNIGSEERMEFTVIGDPVNIASRLEGLTKVSDFKILIDETVFQRVKGEFECVFIGEEQVKGKRRLVKIYGIPDPLD